MLHHLCMPCRQHGAVCFHCAAQALCCQSKSLSASVAGRLPLIISVCLACMPCQQSLQSSCRDACTGTLPPVQRAVLTLLPNLAPTELPQLWPDLIQLHLNLLQPQHLPSQASLSAESSEGHAHANVNRHALTALSMEKTAEMLAALYR